VAALTIGTFDGVHLGHQALLHQARARAGSAPVHALCFDPHPSITLRPHAVPEHLMTFERKRELLLACGATHVHRLAPDPAFLSLSARDFFTHLLRTFAPSAIVEGPDFQFGKGREGNVHILAQLCAQAGIACDIVAPVEVTLTDSSIVRASSSLVRWLVAQGRVACAAHVLGRPAELTGTVVRGDRLGRELGFPTCNIDTPCLLPGDGVYAGLAHLPTGQSLPAAINLSTRPTLASNAPERRLEAHLLRADKPTSWSPLPNLPEYHWPIRLQFVAFVRESVRMPGLPALREQIARDVARIPTLLRVATSLATSREVPA
jgi:riboflavin kinase/FMN adenylyltransferase